MARKLTRRRSRDSERAFLVEGPSGVAAALDAGAMLRDAFVLEGSAFDERLAPHALQVSEPVMRAISDTETPQGPIAIVEMTDVDLHEALASATLVLVLSDVRDPGNAGTLVRSALAAGADCVIFGSGSVDVFSPKTVRASAGAVFGVKIVRDAGMSEVLAALTEAGIEAFAASATGGEDLYDADLSGRVAFVVGNEAWGFRESEDRAFGRTVGIPMPGSIDSLNVAVAGSLLLFEAARQRRAEQHRSL